MGRKAQPVKKTVDAACMQAAVEKRDNAVMAGVDAYAAAAKSALAARRDALKAAWGLADAVQRKAALRAAEAAFKGTWRKAANALRSSKKAAWKQFYADRRACSGTAASEDTMTESIDASL